MNDNGFYCLLTGLTIIILGMLGVKLARFTMTEESGYYYESMCI